MSLLGISRSFWARYTNVTQGAETFFCFFLSLPYITSTPASKLMSPGCWGGPAKPSRTGIPSGVGHLLRDLLVEVMLADVGEGVQEAAGKYLRRLLSWLHRVKEKHSHLTTISVIS